MVQSRPNSLSSTSPNAVSAQSLFLATPMPYSKPSSYLSPTSSSSPPITASIVPDSSRSHVCFEQERADKKLMPPANSGKNDCDDGTDELNCGKYAWPIKSITMDLWKIEIRPSFVKTI